MYIAPWEKYSRHWRTCCQCCFFWHRIFFHSLNYEVADSYNIGSIAHNHRHYFVHVSRSAVLGGTAVSQMWCSRCVHQTYLKRELRPVRGQCLTSLAIGDNLNVWHSGAIYRTPWKLLHYPNVFSILRDVLAELVLGAAWNIMTDQLSYLWLTTYTYSACPQTTVSHKSSVRGRRYGATYT